MKTTSTPPNATQQSWDSSLKLLSAAKHGPYPPVVAGFDGFVDTILHAVSERRSASEYSRLTTLKAFSERILAASSRNLNIEACRGAAVFNPVLISILLIAGVLKATGTSYQTYLALVMSRSLKSKPATFWNRKQLHGTVRMRDQRSMSNCLKVMAQN